MALAEAVGFMNYASERLEWLMRWNRDFQVDEAAVKAAHHDGSAPITQRQPLPRGLTGRASHLSRCCVACTN